MTLNRILQWQTDMKTIHTVTEKGNKNRKMWWQCQSYIRIEIGSRFDWQIIENENQTNQKKETTSEKNLATNKWTEYKSEPCLMFTKMRIYSTYKEQLQRQSQQQKYIKWWLVELVNRNSFLLFLLYFNSRSFSVITLDNTMAVWWQNCYQIMIRMEKGKGSHQFWLSWFVFK